MVKKNLDTGRLKKIINFGLEKVTLYMFRGLRGQFKDLVTSLVTKAEPLSYADLHSHHLTHKFLHKTSLTSMGYVAINAPLLPTPNTPPSTFVSQRQSSGNSGRNRGRCHGGWCPNQFSNRGNRPAAPNQIFTSSMDPPTVTIDKVIGSAKGGRIHVTNCAKHLAIQPLIVLNFSNMDMDSSLVQIWH